jgi:hypothetical protein
MRPERLNMFKEICEILKQERLARSSAVIVGLILVLVAHAPIFPVVAGCALAMGIIVLRGLSRSTRNSQARAGR